MKSYAHLPWSPLSSVAVFPFILLFACFDTFIEFNGSSFSGLGVSINAISKSKHSYYKKFIKIIHISHL